MRPSILVALASFSLIVPVQADERTEYIEFAKGFSMECYPGGRSGTDPALLATGLNTLALHMETPALSRAGEQFEVVGAFYVASRIKGSRALFSTVNEAEQLRLAKLAFEAGFFDDSKKKAALLERTLPAALEHLSYELESKDLYFKAAELHAKLWKDILPIARKISGDEAADSPLAFEIMVNTHKTVRPELCFYNNSGLLLHNVTIHVETNMSKSRLGDARSYIVFHPHLAPPQEEWRPGQMFTHSRLPPSLIDAIPLTTVKLPARQKCIKYSIWCDELRREDVVVSLRRQKPELMFPENHEVAMKEARKQKQRGGGILPVRQPPTSYLYKLSGS